MIILLNNFDIILLKEFGLIEEFELIDDNIKNFDIIIYLKRILISQYFGLIDILFLIKFNQLIKKF
jgi:hypothetical protein